MLINRLVRIQFLRLTIIVSVFIKKLVIKACLFRKKKYHAPLCGLLAQLVEHLTFNQVVAGSIPAQPTTSFSIITISQQTYSYLTTQGHNTADCLVQTQWLVTIIALRL